MIATTLEALREVKLAPTQGREPNPKAAEILERAVSRASVNVILRHVLLAMDTNEAAKIIEAALPETDKTCRGCVYRDFTGRPDCYHVNATTAGRARGAMASRVAAGLRGVCPDQRSGAPGD